MQAKKVEATLKSTASAHITHPSSVKALANEAVTNTKINTTSNFAEFSSQAADTATNVVADTATNVASEIITAGTEKLSNWIASATIWILGLLTVSGVSALIDTLQNIGWFDLLRIFIMMSWIIVLLTAIIRVFRKRFMSAILGFILITLQVFTLSWLQSVDAKSFLTSYENATKWSENTILSFIRSPSLFFSLVTITIAYIWLLKKRR